MANDDCPRCKPVKQEIEWPRDSGIHATDIKLRFIDGIWLFCRQCGKKTFRAVIDDRPLIYVATPYKDTNEAIMQVRSDMAARITGRLVEYGYDAYSPIVHNRILAIHCNLPHKLEFWKNFDRTMLTRSDVLLVIQAHGWEESEGVQWEIGIAVKYNIPTLLAPEDFFDDIDNLAELFKCNPGMTIDV